MKRIFVLLLLPLLLISCKSKVANPNVVEKWDNGNPKIMREYSSKKDNNYIYTEFFKDGNIKLKQNFINDKPDGSSKYFDDEGYLQMERKYIKGILSSEYNYKLGKLNGSEKIYHSNGQLWTERILADGKPWQVVSNFDSTGKPMDAGTLKEGYGTIKLYDKNGNLLETRSYKEGLEVLKQNDKPKQ